MGKLHTVVLLVALICVVAPTKGSLYDKFISILESKFEDEIVKELKDLEKPVKDAGGYVQLNEDDCWYKCGKKGGKCPKACGENGFCCRKGFDDCSAEMAAVSTIRHTCVVPKESSGLRCKGIDNGCCTKATPCKEGDGDCDNHFECEGDLRCGTDNCPWGDEDDCCEKRKKCTGEDSGCCVPGSECGVGEGDCDNNEDCQEGLICGDNNCPWGDNDDCCIDVSGLRCKGEDNGCCTKANPCGDGDGDCDSDSECQKGMICGNDNCPWGDNDDCCADVSGLRCKGDDNGCCTEANPCKEFDGDCDNHKQCEGDLRCGTDNCPWGDEDDCCEKRKKCTGEDSGCCVPGSECGVGEGDCDNNEDCQEGLICGDNNCPWGDNDDCCIDVSGLRCKGVDNGCCTKATPCAEGDGDCDNHFECEGDLRCGTDNCPWGDGDDCCEKRKKCTGEDSGCCVPGSECGVGEGDCDDNEDCQKGLICGDNNCPWGDNDDCCIDVSGLRCKGVDNGCCTKATPCKEGDGDCDNHFECEGDLRCGTDNCPWGDEDDCCEKRKKCTGEDSGCCVPGSECGVGEGDCDDNEDCQKGLICGDNNCPWGDNDDCCVAPKPKPVNGGYSNFGPWGSCSVKCGGGKEERSRSCNNPAPAHGGAKCQGPAKESRDCNKKACPVNGGYGNFGSWSDCSVTCGGGKQERSRSCDNPSPAHGGAKCQGAAKETRDCNKKACPVPVNGGWSAYAPYPPCSKSCGGGVQKTTRVCNNPKPSNGGRNCPGASVWTRSCNTQSCSKKYFSWFRKAAKCEHPIKSEGKCRLYQEGRTNGKKPRQEVAPTFEVITDVRRPRGCIIRYERIFNKNVVVEVKFNDAVSDQTCDWDRRSMNHRWRCICWKYE